MEEHIEDAQVQGYGVALQHLDGHQQRVLQEVAAEEERGQRGAPSCPPTPPQGARGSFRARQLEREMGPKPCPAGSEGTYL